MAIVTKSLEIDELALVKRAVTNAMAHECGDCERWVAVADTFAIDGTSAIELCRYFDLDPHEIVHGPQCLACEP